MWACRVVIWRCDADGDVYWVRPADAPLRITDLMNWHRVLGHGGEHPSGRHLTWTVYGRDEAARAG